MDIDSTFKAMKTMTRTTTTLRQSNPLTFYVDCALNEM